MKLWFFSFVFILAACDHGPRVIDGSSKDSFYKSYGRMLRSSSKEVKDSLRNAHKGILGHQANNIDAAINKVRVALDGYNSAQFLSHWDSIREAKLLVEEAISLGEIQLIETVNVEILSKNFNGSEIEYRVRIDNRSNKDISALKGHVEFIDKFDEVIKGLSLKYEYPISAKGSKEISLQSDYNQFIESDNRLATLPLESIKVEWIPESIVFKDKSRIPILEK